MKGKIETICDRGNRVYDEMIFNKSHSKDMAVLFTIKVLSNNMKSINKNHLYNTYRFIQKHPYIFGDRIRFHIKNIIYNKLTYKQQNREKMYKLNICDYDETDTESDNESEIGIDYTNWCERCELERYKCDC